MLVHWAPTYFFSCPLPSYHKQQQFLPYGNSEGTRHLIVLSGREPFWIKVIERSGISSTMAVSHRKRTMLFKQYYPRGCALTSFGHDSDAVSAKVHKQNWSAQMIGISCIIAIIWALQWCDQDRVLAPKSASRTEMRCIIKIYPCWWTICAQILKVFASVHRVSMETHGVWLITETKSVTSVDSYV